MLALPLFLIASLTMGSAARASLPRTGCTGPYGWPIEPVDQPHPIRGAFGDPRTVFKDARSEHAVLKGGGSFSFHQGVDISAPDGSPVYAVSSGTVVRARGGRVTVDCGNGRSFQYWHIEPAARVGQHAIAGKTVLGFIQPKREHVHLTHLESGRAMNPVALGRLTPYRDATLPIVLDIAIHDRVGQPVEGVASGRVRLVANASDMPALAVPGRWHGFPVTPALVTWRIETARGRIVARERTARDVRATVPANALFWSTWARGTHQNWPVFSGRKERGMTGTYLFALSHDRFDTRRLPDGDYRLVVMAEDTGGNRGSSSLLFTVNNTG